MRPWYSTRTLTHALVRAQRRKQSVNGCGLRLGLVGGRRRLIFAPRVMTSMNDGQCVIVMRINLWFWWLTANLLRTLVRPRPCVRSGGRPAERERERRKRRIYHHHCHPSPTRPAPSITYDGSIPKYEGCVEDGWWEAPTRTQSSTQPGHTNPVASAHLHRTSAL